ncbi:MAG: hypothetical protein AABW52_00490 [Nanoarchaeota archaeon]
MNIDELLETIDASLRSDVKITYEMCIEKLGHTEEEALRFTHIYAEWAERVRPEIYATRESERIRAEDLGIRINTKYN